MVLQRGGMAKDVRPRACRIYPVDRVCLKGTKTKVVTEDDQLGSEGINKRYVGSLGRVVGDSRANGDIR